MVAIAKVASAGRRMGRAAEDAEKDFLPTGYGCQLSMPYFSRTRRTETFSRRTMAPPN